MRQAFTAIFCLIVPLLLARPVLAHGVGAGPVLAEKEAVRFYYSDGEPMAYAEVLVFGPDSAKVEFQNGRTDKNGVFAFVPDRPGFWRVVCNDGMGHRAEYKNELVSGKETKATESAMQEPDGKQSAPLWLKALLGVSLLFNLALGIRIVRNGTKTSAA